MGLLNREERRLLKEFRIARFYEMERQFYLVTEFYPARRLTIYVDQFKIMDIMNCDAEKACSLLKKIGKKEGNEHATTLRTSDFCRHVGIDEMLVQVFLASFIDEEPLPPVKRLPALTRGEIIVERPGKIQDAIENLRNGIMENTLTYQIRGTLWEHKNPMGEPMYKRKKYVQMVIRAFEVAQMYGYHIDTAREMLREVREKERELYPDSKLRRHVSINKFCEVHNWDEKDLRKHLAELHKPDDDEDDDD